MKQYSKEDLIKVLFIYTAIIIGIIGAWFRIKYLMATAIVMIGISIAYVRYYTMKERLNKNEKKLR